MFRIKQFVSRDFCLNCLGCCRYNCNPSIWAPNLLEEEKGILDLERLELITYKESYICRFLNPKNNLCGIYTHRPLECRLYPFLLNRCGRRIYLSVDLNCRFIKDKINPSALRRTLFAQGRGERSRTTTTLRIDGERSRTIDSRIFKRYLSYLTQYLQRPSVLSILSKNCHVFSSYPGTEVLNLAELKI